MTAPPDTAAVIWSAVRAAGYEETGEGVLNLLMDYIDGGKPEEKQAPGVGDLLAGYLKDNPDKARQIAAAAKLVGQAVLRKFS